jgi:hypothetical protein
MEEKYLSKKMSLKMAFQIKKFINLYLPAIIVAVDLGKDRR